MLVLLAAAGGAVGTGLRVLAGVLLGAALGARPAAAVAVLVVDVVGTGALVALLARGPSPRARALLGTGFCGGLTTMSGVAVLPLGSAPEPAGTAALVAAAVAAGGAGSAVRAVAGRLGVSGTLMVNLVGSALLGALLDAPASVHLVLGAGLCGGLTTFSTYAVEVRRLGGPRGAVYAVGTPLACVAVAAATRAVAG